MYMVMKRNLDRKPKKRFFKSKKRDLPETSNRRVFVERKLKRRDIEDTPDEWWEDRILSTLKKPIHGGGGYLFDHGLFIFSRLTTVKVPRHVIDKLVDDDKIRRVQDMKHHTYKLIYRRREL